MTTEFHLAQCNIARLRAPLTDPSMQGYMEDIAPLNQLAEQSPGYVWRLQDDAGDATSIQVFDDPLLLINLSVWADLASLKAYVYQGAHLASIKTRKQWFNVQPQPRLVLWWVKAGTLPTTAQAKARLEQLALHGPGPEAFSFAHPFPAPSVIMPA
ncbi:hypothetical protein HNQ59_000101 [Chitinivorax tropicus]|uniref:DUF3291 domain-containing protein n=1 Tax=Chitinivorax tropicus TaxID=714531 RepID=A0A840MI22_9PROT|nr:DUF3291 domain-containing protein [Chitinivorax tropicus]MBB5016839.1 hypothetical protein [Chitinivorax tropicus]